MDIGNTAQIFESCFNILTLRFSMQNYLKNVAACSFHATLYTPYIIVFSYNDILLNNEERKSNELTPSQLLQFMLLNNPKLLVMNSSTNVSDLYMHSISPLETNNRCSSSLLNVIYLLRYLVHLTYHLSLLLVPFSSQFRLGNLGRVWLITDAHWRMFMNSRRRQYLPQFAQEGSEKWHHWAFGHRQSSTQGSIVFCWHECRRQEIQDWQSFFFRDRQPEWFELIRSVGVEKKQD